MARPSNTNPDAARDGSSADPFLEFDSETQAAESQVRPTPGVLDPLRLPQPRPLAPPAYPGLFKPGQTLGLSGPEPLPKRPSRSAISPEVAFAIGVAGLVAAGMAYYQTGRILADRRAAVLKSLPAPSAPASVAPPAPLPTTGRMELTSDPPGARVSVNGLPRGVTPLILNEMPPGQYEVVVTSGDVPVTRSVTVTPGTTATLMVSGVGTVVPPADGTQPPPGGPAVSPVPQTGFVQFQAPIDLNVLENGRSRGSTRNRLTLPEGTHRFELVSDAFQVRQTVTVTVVGGQTTRRTVAMPMGSLSINATPWAEVWVNGQAVGTTPLANLDWPIGLHEVVFRHPTLGERRQVVIVTAGSPARVGVDLR